MAEITAGMPGKEHDMDPQKPTVGRIVHYHHQLPDGSLVTLAALVVKVFSETCVNLKIFTDGYTSFFDAASGAPAGDTLKTSVTKCDGEPRDYSWSWPPRA